MTVPTTRVALGGLKSPEERALARERLALSAVRAPAVPLDTDAELRPLPPKVVAPERRVAKREARRERRRFPYAT